MRTPWQRKPAWAAASTRSCEPAILRSRTYCRARRRSPRSRSDREDLRQDGSGDGTPELGGGRSDARAAARDFSARRGERHRNRPPLVSEKAPELRAKGYCSDDGRQRRSAPGERLPRRRHLARGHRQMGEARYRSRYSGLGHDDLHPVQHVCAGLSSRSIRAKVYDPGERGSAPATFKATPYKGLDFKNKDYTIQVAPEDCTGCNLCVNVCPAKDRTNPRHKAIDMQPMPPLRDAERENYAFFLSLPETERSEVTRLDHKGSQFLEPLFEYSGACAGCGETPYIKLLTQLFGDRLLIANATGCTSIYGGNLRLLRIPRIATDAVRPGPIRCSKTTRSLALAFAWESIVIWPPRARWSSVSRRNWATRGWRSCLAPTRRVRVGSRRSANASRRCARSSPP